MSEKEDRGRNVALLQMRHRTLAAIRQFFYDRGYLEVETPYLMKTAPSDPFIEPLKVYVGREGPYYLHTSPEIGMKKALACGVERIFQVCKVFRVEEFQERHSIEFTMVEWYRPGTYRDTMEETKGLVQYVGETAGASDGALQYLRQPWKTYEAGRLFLEFVGFDPVAFSADDLRAAMKERGFQGTERDENWADLFFRLLVQEVEPRLLEREDSPYFIKDWPVALTAMARRKDNFTAERFELYMKGLEIANGYSELLEPDEQRSRIGADNEIRRAEGKDLYPPDEEFLTALGAISGPMSGVSVGVDRLIMILLGKDRISDVLPDRFVW